MSETRLFEGFFWIEPRRPSAQDDFSSTITLWHYPPDVSSLTMEFRDIPQFCFPDLETIRIERPETQKNDNFTFTLTDSAGSRVYGICLRVFSHGEGKRYDVKRRPKCCLCLITRLPFFSMFRTVLLQVHSLCLLEYDIKSARALLETIYCSPVPLHGDPIRIPKSTHLLTQHDLILNTPKGTGQSHMEVPILPLLEAVGVDRFMLILSALMCEKRMIFVADDIGTLSSLVLAANSMLYPFQWQHIFIPLLPSKLLSYAAAPVPYIIGVRRYLMSRVKKEAIEDVIIVDLDTGECSAMGGAKITDFVGDSGSMQKQASDQFERAKAKATSVASTVWGWGTSAGKQAVQDSSHKEEPKNKDLAMVMIADLRSIMSAKPGSNSLQAVAGSLMRGAGDSSYAKWSVQAEQVLRETLLLFTSYLFYDIDELIAKKAAMARKGVVANRGETENGETFGEGDSRAAFNLREFITRRRQMTDTKEIQIFLGVFVHSQMFERFCASRVKKFEKKEEAFTLTDRTTGDEQDEYDRICLEIKSKQVAATVMNVKNAIKVLRGFGSSMNLSEDESDAVKVLEFHDLTLQVTSPRSKDSDISAYAERICVDACQSEQLLKITRTIRHRLNDVNSKQAGKALSLLHILLLSGPEAILSEALDFIPHVRLCLDPSNYKATTMDYLSIGGSNQSTVDLKPKAQAVLQLLLDQGKLEKQRKWSNLWRNGAFEYMRYSPLKVDVLTGTAYQNKFLPSLADLHTTFQPLDISSAKSQTYLGPPRNENLEPTVMPAESKPPAAFASATTAIATNLIDLDFH